MSVELEDIEKFSLFYGKGVSQEHPMISHAENSATVHQRYNKLFENVRGVSSSIVICSVLDTPECV